MPHERVRQLVISALMGESLSQLAETHSMSKSGVEQTLKRVINGIYKLTRKDDKPKLYSLELARQDSQFILSKLDTYLSGALKETQLPALTKSSSLAATGLSPRVLNPLISHNIATIYDVISCSRDDLKNLDGFGKGALEKLVAVLKKHGFHLKCAVRLQSKAALNE